MFYHLQKRIKSLRSKRLQDLLPINSASQLLSEEKRNALLLRIKKECSLPEAQYESLCLKLIHDFAAYCQTLPETSNNYYSQSGGLIDYALHRTEAALDLFRHYVIQDEHKEFSEEQRLWQYALFSAALMQGIGKLKCEYLIDLYDSQGHLLKPWNPLLEDLMSQGSHFSYELQKEANVSTRCLLNILLARRLMPESGFAWIASNSQVLAVWLALLNEDNYESGTLGAILIRADAIAIQRYFYEFWLLKAHAFRSRFGQIGTFVDSVPESLDEIEQQLGVQFLQWLTTALEGGKLELNKPPLFMVPGGLLMSAEVFKLFVREHPQYKNWQAIQNGFLSLGLHSLGPDGTVISRFEQVNQEKMNSGIVFSKFAIALPETVQLHNMANKTSVSISAMELLHLAKFTNYFSAESGKNVSPLSHLTVSGDWQTPAAVKNQSGLAPGSKPGG